MSNVLESIVGTLPAKVQPYAKTYAAAVVTGVTVASGLLDLPVWVTIALAIANAPVVFFTPNLDPNAEKQDESVQPPAIDVDLSVDETTRVDGIFRRGVSPGPVEPTGYGSGV